MLDSRPWLGSVAAILVGALALTMSVPQPVAAQSTLVDSRLDLTGNSVVNAADVAEAMETWSDAFAAGSCAGAGLRSDVNGDACVSVIDVQRIAAHMGGGTNAAALRMLGMTRQQAAPEKTFVVNSAASGDPNNAQFGDINRGDGVCATGTGACTLQAALQETNAPRVPPYRAIINFDIRPDGNCPDSVKILPNLDYQRWLQIDDSSSLGTVIDGYSQCGAQANTGDVTGNAVLKIEIIGTKFGTNGAEFPARIGVNGLEIKSGSSVVRGLSLYNWDRAFELSGPGVLYNHLEGNFTGTNPNGAFMMAKSGVQHREGIRMQFGASYNVVGCGSFDTGGQFLPCTDQAQINAARNIVAGNGNDGIHLESPNTSNNHIVGNYIGVFQDGVTALRNAADGVDFEAGPQSNWLGGETPAERNIVSRNVSDGIEISHEPTTQFNRVVGNYFGLDVNGNPAANGDGGISFEDRVNNNFAYNNVVAGNDRYGVRFYVAARENEVYNNKVGVGPDGVTPRPNGEQGVYVMGGSQHNKIHDNIIAYNASHGVEVNTESDPDHNYFGETYFNTISKNSIFNNTRRGIYLNDYMDSGILGNQGLAAPHITAVNDTLVVGETCPNCKVEVFLSDKGQVPNPGGDDNGEGRTFIGEGIANGSGQFAVSISGAVVGQLVTATATDELGNTSEFARNTRVNAGAVATLTPAPTFTPTMTATSTPTVTPTGTPGTRVDQPYNEYLPVVIHP